MAKDKKFVPSVLNNKRGRVVQVTKHSGERVVSTLGAVKFEDQVKTVTRLGIRSYVNRALANVKIEDFDKFEVDITRELGFDLADFSEVERLVAMRRERLNVARAAANASAGSLERTEAKPQVASAPAQEGGAAAPRPDRL